MWLSFEGRSTSAGSASALFRNSVLKKNFEKSAMSNINPGNFIVKLKDHLEHNAELINPEVKRNLGSFLQDKCLDALENWDMIIEPTEYPANYSPLSSISDSPPSDSPRSQNEAEPAVNIQIEVAGESGSESSSEANEPCSTATIDNLSHYIDSLCQTLEKLTNSNNRRNENFPNKWTRFQIEVLRETAALIGIKFTVFSQWFH